jgi:hypothetical protein
LGAQYFGLGDCAQADALEGKNDLLASCFESTILGPADAPAETGAASWISTGTSFMTRRKMATTTKLWFSNFFSHLGL